MFSASSFLYFMKKDTHTHTHAHSLAHTFCLPYRDNGRTFSCFMLRTVFAVLHIKFFLQKSLLFSLQVGEDSSLLLSSPLLISLHSWDVSHFSSVIFGAANLVGMHNFFLMPSCPIAEKTVALPLCLSCSFYSCCLIRLGIRRSRVGKGEGGENEIFKCLLPS